MIVFSVRNFSLRVEHKSRVRSGQMLKDRETRILCWKRVPLDDEDDTVMMMMMMIIIIMTIGLRRQHVVLVIAIFVVFPGFDLFKSYVFLLCSLCLYVVLLML